MQKNNRHTCTIQETPVIIYSDKINNNTVSSKCKYKIDFNEINQIAATQFRALVMNWIPNGDVKGCNYLPLNPTRADKHIGSFVINTQTTQWIDFATGDKGLGAISLYMYVNNLQIKEAAEKLHRILNIGEKNGK